MLALTDKEFERLSRKFTVGDGCWEWTAAKTTAGYAELMVGSRMWYGHRLLHEMFIGPIPAGYEVDHLCRNRGCVRPDHLEAVPPHINNARSDSFSAVHARKSHCPQGHPYDEANTRMYRGSRRCRACSRARCRARRQRLKREG